MSSLTGEFPRAVPRAVWLGARARNAMNRPLFIGAVGAGAFIAALAALVLAPQEVRHVRHLPAPAGITRPDTTPLVAALTQARIRLASAESSLSSARAHAATAPAPVVDTLSPKLIQARDSLATAVNDLDALLARVETAPVTASYRALAESPQLSANARIKSLIDSLADVDRDRESYGTTGGADPVFLALNSRASEIGRSIQLAAQQRRDDLRSQITKLNAPSQQLAIAKAPAVDTAGWVAERDSAQSLVSEASASLVDARSRTKEYNDAVEHAREDAQLSAPPVALLAAALVFGVALGFGVSFFDEMRHPRVSSDEHEVERLTATRVLATVAPRPRDPNRSRRAADRSAPRYPDPRADGYQLPYLHVARAGASRLMLTVASADTNIAAVVAMNVAAIAADEARSTILIDTDARSGPVASAIRTHAEPGLADVLQRQTNWSEMTAQAVAGRDRTIDVLPSGVAAAPLDPARVNEVFRNEAARLARHYEAIVLVASVDQAASGLPATFPIPDAIICARVGYTKVSDLNSAIDRIRASGGNPLGIVLWNSASPALSKADRVARNARPARPKEMAASAIE
jgi:Mrp family chromosome partitioning ATPase